MNQDWRTVFTYPYWLVAVLCFAVGCSGMFCAYLYIFNRPALFQLIGG